MEMFQCDGWCSAAIMEATDIWFAVALVVQFNSKQRLHCLRMTDKKINVLAVNLVLMGVEFISFSDEENICQIHLGADDTSISDHQLQNPKEREFGGGQEVVPEPIGKLFGIGRSALFFEMNPEEFENCRKAASGLGGRQPLYSKIKPATA